MRDQELDVPFWPLYPSMNLYTCPLPPHIVKKKRIISVIEKDESLQSLVLYSCLCAFITRLWKQKLIPGFLDPATGLQREKKIRLYPQTERQTWQQLISCNRSQCLVTHRAGVLGQLSPPCAYLPRSNLLLGFLGRIHVRSVTHTWSKVTMPHNSAVSRTSCLAWDFVEI